MKEHKTTQLASAIALWALAAGGAQAQNPGISNLAEPRSVDFAVDDKASDDDLLLEADLMRQLRDLETATQRKRVELQARIAQQAAIREAEEASKRLNPHRFPGAPSTFEFPLEPQWIIGVAVAPGSDDGVKVRSVLPDSPAAGAGVQEGDLIQSVNGIRVRKLEPLNAIINAAKKQKLKLQIRRGEDTLNKVLTPALKSGLLAKRDAESSPGIDIIPVPDQQEDIQENEARWRPRIGDRQYTYQLQPPARSADLQALKGEIAELRELIRDLAENSVEEEEGDDDHDEDDEDDDEDD